VTDVRCISPFSEASHIDQAIRSGAEHIVIGDQPDRNVVRVLLGALTSSGAATASPVPVNVSGTSIYPLHPLLPPPPTLPVPCVSLCVLDVATASLIGSRLDAAGSAADLVSALGERAMQYGWRHVASPGLAHNWDPATATNLVPAAGWTTQTVETLSGPANRGLEAHRTWAESRLRPIRVLVDGACLGGDLHTGTQHLVLEVSQWMSRARPNENILIAAPTESMHEVEELLVGTGVEVVDRSTAHRLDVDVLYRPYQMLRLEERELFRTVGRRRLVGQLDMIGFSNPFYHPSANLFAFARNLQRDLMRTADGVTFISQYGLDAGVAECPDLEPRRLHMVSCGADPRPIPGARPGQLGGVERFVLCLSATFWHKNRVHAIETFAHLAQTNEYDGDLVIIGPEPFYGRSTADEDQVLGHLPVGIRNRIHRWGQATDADKWWLLQHADAVTYPSVVEGFGLVPFEAAAAGTPCLSFAGTAQGELLGNTNATISTWDVEAWSERLRAWCDDPALGRQTVEDVRGVAALQTWARCADLTWQAVDAALALPQREIPGTEDLGRFTQVASAGSMSNSLRFTAARAQPAAERRIKRLVGAFRRQTGE